MSDCTNCEDPGCCGGGCGTNPGGGGGGTNGPDLGPGCTPTWSPDAGLASVGRPGGVQITWNLPADSPECVAFTEVYRAGSPEFNNSVLLTTAGSTLFFNGSDIEQETTYWYWIKFKATSGQDSPVYGPTAATAWPLIEQIIEELTDKITDSQLAQSLREEIEDITRISQDLINESQARLFGDEITQEMIDGLNLTLAEIDGAIIALSEKVITDEKAYIAQIDALIVQFNANIAQYQETLVTFANADVATLQYVETLKVGTDATAAALQTEVELRAGADDALASTITQLEASTSATDAALYTELIVQANNDVAMAASIETLQVTVDGEDGESGLTALIETTSEIVGVDSDGNPSGEPDSLMAQYSLKISNDGLISGFGLYNDGEQTSFGIHADTFFVGSPENTNPGFGYDPVYPFIISKWTPPLVNGVYQPPIDVIALNAFTMIPDAAINTAMIKTASITNALIGDSITSDDFISTAFNSGVGRGWGIFKDFFGNGARAEFNNIIARGTIFANHIETNSINIIDEPGFFKPGVVTSSVINNIQSDNFYSYINAITDPDFGTTPAKTPQGWSINNDIHGKYGDLRWNTGETDESGNLGIPGQPGWPGGYGWTENSTGDVYPYYVPNSVRTYFYPVDAWQSRWYSGPELKPEEGSLPIAFVEIDDLHARGNITASSLEVGTAMVTTLNINGNAVTVGNTVTKIPSYNAATGKKRIYGALSRFEHQGGRIQVSISLTAEAGSNAGVFVEIFFNDGSGGKKEKILWDNQQSGNSLAMSIPVGFTFASQGGALGAVAWEVNLSGAGSYQEATVDEITATITVLKR